ncbi:MAG TPA: GNAT family N-acetyltransferase [Bacteroidales bacterium]|nr:GNAT family N-acetyltransferase [Bacteroidales bacterium]HPT52051.1 GNAT family N-acetyltransferase [Bacteroidales bacterium]
MEKKLKTEQLNEFLSLTSDRSVPMIMQTPRLILRAWFEEDAPVLFKYASDPDLGPRAGWAPHQSLNESRNLIRTLFTGNAMWAVEWKETSEVIGCVGYLLYNQSNIPIQKDEAEVGYWIAKPYWNSGICTEALQAVVDCCFEEKKFLSLWGSYFLDNPASVRVMEKCGFSRCEGQTVCPNLQVGSDKPVGLMKIEKGDR